jgi:hypothetical protein
LLSRLAAGAAALTAALIAACNQILINQTLVSDCWLNRSGGSSQPWRRSPSARSLPTTKSFLWGFLLSRLAAGTAALATILQSQIVTYATLSSL